MIASALNLVELMGAGKRNLNKLFHSYEHQQDILAPMPNTGVANEGKGFK